MLVNRGRGNDELAPSDALYRDFESTRSQLEKDLGKGSADAHNTAFLQCDYERRFREQVAADAAALARLEQLARRAEREDVYLVCYEGLTKACHRRILLRIAAAGLRRPRRRRRPRSPQIERSERRTRASIPAASNLGQTPTHRRARFQLSTSRPSSSGAGAGHGRCMSFRRRRVKRARWTRCAATTRSARSTTSVSTSSPSASRISGRWSSGCRRCSRGGACWRSRAAPDGGRSTAHDALWTGSPPT